MNTPKRAIKVRSTSAQMNLLVDFMAQNPIFINVDSGGTREHADKWQELADVLAQHGPSKTLEQWRCTWKDLKKNARRKRKRVLNEEGVEFTELHQRVLSIMEDDDENGSSSEAACFTWKDLKKNARRKRKRVLNEEGVEFTELHQRVLSIMEDDDENGSSSEAACFDESQEPKNSSCFKNYDLIKKGCGETTAEPAPQPRKTHQKNFVLVKKGCDNPTEEPAPQPRKTHQKNFVLVKKGCDNPEDYLEPKPKKRREDVFVTVRRCFVNMMKNKLCSPTLFDNAQFRDVIALLPMTSREKELITSSYIQTCAEQDTSCHLKLQNTSMDQSAHLTDHSYLSEDNSTTGIKVETDSEATTTVQTTDSAVSEHNTLLKFFEVSQDRTTCDICNKTVTCPNISTLKEHLENEHPFTQYIHECNPKEDERQNDDDTPCNLGIEEVFLEGNSSDNETSTKLCEEPRKGPFIIQSTSEIPLEFTGPITREYIAASLQRFKSLDSFGPYVVSLMKLIPKEKCIEFQIEMVERLLREQAVAG